MTVLNESARRFWTLTLFFLLGPGLVCLLGYRLFSRTTTNALTRTEIRLSEFTGYRVNVSRREYLRPGAQRILDVYLTSNRSKEKIAFCPEIYLITENDLNFIRSFAASLDVRGDFNSQLESAAETDASKINESVNAKALQPYTDSPKRSSLEQLLCSNPENNNESTPVKNFDNYSLVVIPTMYCRNSQFLEIKSNLCKLLCHELQIEIEQPSQSIVCGLAVGNLLLQTNKEFEAANSKESKIPLRKTNQELAKYFQIVDFDVQQSDSDLGNEALIRAFEAKSPIVKHLQALYFHNTKETRLDAIFSLDESLQDEPYYLSLETFPSLSTSRVEFDAQDQIIPCSFVSNVLPFFQNFGKNSWFSGKITVCSFVTDKRDSNANQSSSAPTKSNEGTSVNNSANGLPFWVAELNNFRLHNCKMETLSAQMNIPELSGVLSDLEIVHGVVRQGVFEGKGQLKIKNGTIPTKILTKLCMNDCLEIVPSNVLNYRFLNDSMPFNELEFQFNLTQEGVIFDSEYKNKIIACYDKGNVKYGFFLPKSTAGRLVSYAKPLSALFDGDENAFWTPLVRDAIRHLPVTSNDSTHAPSTANKVTDTFKR